MDRLKVQELLDKMTKYVPISKIEACLKMPKNTLQKALSETEKRGLPKKWVRIFTEFVNYKQYLTMGKEKIQDANKQTNQAEALKVLGSDKTNYSINTEATEKLTPYQEMLKKKRGF